MSGVVLRCAGRVDGTAGPETGRWLQRFNAEALGGRGWARWTGDPAEALRFAERADAVHASWTSPPLTPFRVLIEPAP